MRVSINYLDILETHELIIPITSTIQLHLVLAFLQHLLSKQLIIVLFILILTCGREIKNIDCSQHVFEKKIIYIDLSTST